MRVWRSGGLLALFSSWACADSRFDFQPAQTSIAQDIHDLHSWLMVVILVIFCLVFGVMFYAIFKHRRSLGHNAKPFHENTAVEVAWTLIPALILVVMAWPAAKVVLAQKDSHDATLTIKATGYQWFWGYDYLDSGFGYKSKLVTPRSQIENYKSAGDAKGEHYLLEVDEPLVVPVDTKVRILTTSNDVIHSWAMPAFGVKQDAIPGFIRDTWFKAERTGIFRGQCSELCGRDHGFMPIVVKVVSKDDYKTWLGKKQAEAKAAADDPNKTWTRDELIARGQKVYEANCVACHKADGKGGGPFPALAGSKIATGPKEGHVHIVLTGKNAMPSWAGLTDTEIAAVITYERNSFGNKTGDFVLPKDVKAARK
ncbi:cytochrome c oxidase subunit 2 [Andreprevotia lacus DSM 23236]|uniref:Cytochrome c oxidase subunit 2 n=1 Tax=Andreprevotia lacus DSM 23236 TaxID=1121001 RepID=A0A1W1XZ32_9NEIS|nr:cytochrome c oxidase subunit II [Andreprevotia lacus]SMC29176.1 cytochrome c oxidase subunit 2 [Andreprevotia lacus DSM 23236]